MSITSIIFDLGGVILFHDWEIMTKQFETFSGRHYKDIGKEIKDGNLCADFMRGRMSSPEFHTEFCNFLGVEIPYKKFVDIWNSPFSLNKGIIDILDALKPNYILSIGSNTDPMHFPNAIQSVCHLKEFKRFFLSYELGYLKPEPEFFITTLKELSVIPEESIFIDDRVVNVAAAAKLGLKAIQFRSNEQLKEELKALVQF